MDNKDLKQEFRELMRVSGWSQAEAARQLAMTPSALSQIVRRNSPVRPSPVTLRLFQLLLWRGKPEAAREMVRREIAPTDQAWEKEIIQALRQLPSKSRQGVLRRLRTMIAAAKTAEPGAPPSASSRKGCKFVDKFWHFHVQMSTGEV